MQNKALMRLAAVDKHVKVVKKKKPQPTLNVWDHMGLDAHLSMKGVELRKAVDSVMEASREELNEAYSKAKFPFFMLERIAAIGVNGLVVKPEHGGPGIDFVDTAAISF